jgi:hypothetical protein
VQGWVEVGFYIFFNNKTLARWNKRFGYNVSYCHNSLFLIRIVINDIIHLVFDNIQPYL